MYGMYGLEWAHGETPAELRAAKQTQASSTKQSDNRHLAHVFQSIDSDSR